MKTILSILTAATILAAPMAQAQDYRGHDRGRHAPVERKVIIEKKKVVVHRGHWKKGQRLSRAERARYAEIRDYRRYRLSAPPRGYHWVRADNEFLLIGAASGLIAGIIAGR
ncbi:RcnB family protein [Rhizobium sp. SL86]|jgi:Ni/Co efflux regulator RcnB|uniref:RcnB family protein n=1 Tax=Rhizobium sp. SL86 TaxID=2995148 RepID=UPI0022735272|nr:RcnB family protein [Rhizobium sp. SL86]MCY1669097.1 RcnB family protein [Rhizobium sp. SL86]